LYSAGGTGRSFRDLGPVDETLEAADIDKEPEVDDAADDAVELLVGRERVKERLPSQPLALFDELLVGNHQVLVAPRQLEDLELDPLAAQFVDAARQIPAEVRTR